MFTLEPLLLTSVRVAMATRVRPVRARTCVCVCVFAFMGCICGLAYVSANTGEDAGGRRAGPHTLK